jgi:hypothetical protein
LKTKTPKQSIFIHHCFINHTRAMQPSLEKSNYPIFEANQVLSNRHLNQVFDYLDEQERLTRANLIGIGVACGLEVSLGGTAAAPVVLISRGCGVTSEGYLIMEPKDLALVSHKTYTPLLDLRYPLLEGFTVLEMFEEGEPNAKLFSTEPTTFLNDKVVLLFLELKKDNLRNCSPTNCDDRGADVTATVRRLLVSKKDEQKVIRLLDGTISHKRMMTLDAYEQTLLLELNLPDLRLPRYNVTAGSLNSSNAVLASFFTAIRTTNLASQLNNALSAAYNAFKPVVQGFYPSNPFVHFLDGNHYGFLTSAPTNVAQVRFLQYYYDLFDDLIKAYDEFRWKGVELMCACCPPSGLFPRHLMLGLAHPELDSGAAIYRHNFHAASAISDCEKHTEELQQLFRRLVEMTERFSNNPPLHAVIGRVTNTSLDQQIRVTPSKLGDVPLSSKCIPYYYTQNGTPRLFQLWNAEKTQRRKADQNLSYRAEEYAVANFAKNPLLYDLEPHNFLRIEGHLGKNWQRALSTLLTLRNQHRLPFEVIALRTGAFDESMVVDLSKEKCRFEDLELLYHAAREDWMGQLCNDLTYLYDVEPLPGNSIKPLVLDLPFEQQVQVDFLARAKEVNSAAKELPLAQDISLSIAPTEFKSKYSLINTYAAGFLVRPNRLGGLYENNVHIKDIRGINDNFFALFSAILNVADVFSQDINGFNYQNFEQRLKVMLRAAYRVENLREDTTLTEQLKDTPSILLWEEIDDTIEHLKFGFRSDVFKTIYDEYVRRVKDVKQQQFLTNFLLKHPGIQHKAGVPVGGTFILVYHDDPEIVRPTVITANERDLNLIEEISLPVSEEIITQDKAYAARTKQAVIFTPEVEQAFTTLQIDPIFALNPDFNLLVGALSGQVFNPRPNFDYLNNKDASQIIAQFVNGLPDGTVIADFFLPYICCSDCPGVQYVLGQAPLTFSFTVGCTNANNQAPVSILPQGGAQPYSYKVVTLQKSDFQPLTGALVLGVGTHILILRDAENTETASQTVEIKAKITLGAAEYLCKGDGNFYTVSFMVTGGNKPYSTNMGAIGADNKFISKPIASGSKPTIDIIDHNGCKVSFAADHTCPAPLDFKIVPTCTDDSDQALCTIAVTGGTAPFKIKVDNGTESPLTNPIKLPAGAYTVTITDAQKGVSSASVIIPKHLTAVVLPTDYKCLARNTQYQAIITVAGGTPPYKIDGQTILDNKSAQMTFANGSRNTIKVTDSANCETTAIVQHTCVRKVVFDVTIGITKNNQAEVTVKTDGKLDDYKISTDGKNYKAFKNPYILPSGEHSITLQDAEMNVSEPKTITIPNSSTPMLVDAAQYRCDLGKYIGTVQITGGKPPYKVLNETAVGTVNASGLFESKPIASGTALAVTIGDDDGNVANLPLQHVCPPAPCDKPCAGISQKGSYRLWMQPSTPQNGYEMYQSDAVECTFTDEKGTVKQILGLSATLVHSEINKDFHGTMKQLIDKMNASIASTIGANRLVLSYELHDGEPFARLWIEHFQCEMFSLKFKYTYSQGGQLNKYEVHYQKAGSNNDVLFSNLQIDAAAIQIPAFDASLRDQCKGTPPQKVCKEALPRISFNATIAGDQLTLTAIGSEVGKAEIIQWIWEVERSTQALYAGSQIVANVPKIARTGATVKLMGLSKQGCFVTFVQKVNINVKQTDNPKIK